MVTWVSQSWISLRKNNFVFVDDCIMRLYQSNISVKWARNIKLIEIFIVFT